MWYLYSLHSEKSPPIFYNPWVGWLVLRAYLASTSRWTDLDYPTFITVQALAPASGRSRLRYLDGWLGRRIYPPTRFPEEAPSILRKRGEHPQRNLNSSHTRMGEQCLPSTHALRNGQAMSGTTRLGTLFGLPSVLIYVFTDGRLPATAFGIPFSYRRRPSLRRRRHGFVNYRTHYGQISYIPCYLTECQSVSWGGTQCRS